MFENNNDIIKPLKLDAPGKPSEMRRHCHKLAKKLANKVREQLADSSKTLFVFVLRGTMVLYPAFVDEFEDASFCFTYSDYVTKLECTDFDTVVIVDTIVHSGKTLSKVKKLLQEKVTTQNWILAAAFSNNDKKEFLNENFDKVFCLLFMDNVGILADIGAAFTNGDGVNKPVDYLLYKK